VIAANLEVKARDPEAWAILLDTDGNLAEGMGSNIFLVRGGTVCTPREQHVLAGISRETVIELARGLGVPVMEKELDLYDAYNADEAFFTSTSLCICPVRSVNDICVGSAIPGPITQQLTEAYCRLVDSTLSGNT
jgi:branched-chain amino acid aminotransferase